MLVFSGPKYLGGGQSIVNLHTVPQTSEDGATPQANLAAYGTASLNGHGFTQSFTEHGVVIGPAVGASRPDLSAGPQSRLVASHQI